MSTLRAAQTLELLNRATQQRENELLRHSSTPDAESDDDADAESPIFDQFYGVNRNSNIKEMTNFTAREFRNLYSILQRTIASSWNVGRGRKSKYKPMTALLMTLKVLKHGGTWDFLGQPFGIKEPTFERIITGFLTKIFKKLHDTFVADVANYYTRDELKVEKKNLRTFRLL